MITRDCIGIVNDIVSYLGRINEEDYNFIMNKVECARRYNKAKLLANTILDEDRYFNEDELKKLEDLVHSSIPQFRTDVSKYDIEEHIKNKSII